MGPAPCSSLGRISASFLGSPTIADCRLTKFPFKLHTPILDGFVAIKASAWFERRSPRDLFDLEGLSHKVEVTESIQDLVVQVMGFRLSK